MARHTLGRLDTFDDAAATAAVVDGTKVVVYRSGDDVCVVQDRCPHLGLSLTRGPGGLNVSDGEITCPFHNSRFDLCSGENLDWVVGVAGRRVPRWSQRMMAMGRQPSPLTTYDVSIEDGEVWVSIPSGKD